MKELESSKIHEELFQTTTEHKYYSFGVAQGMYMIYKSINDCDKKGFTLTNSELMQIIKEVVKNDYRIEDNFTRLLKDIED